MPDTPLLTSFDDPNMRLPVPQGPMEQWHPGTYVSLFHGRDTLSDELNDWGYDGPTLGPFPFVQVIYGTHMKLGHLHELDIVEGLVMHNNKYYGDFTVFAVPAVAVS